MHAHTTIGRPGTIGLHARPKALAHEKPALAAAAESFPMKLTPYLLALIEEKTSVLGKQFLPDLRELNDARDAIDPLDEIRQSPLPSIIHRYPQRVVLLVSSECAATCRFCMRKRLAGQIDGCDPETIDQGLAYILANRQINEVILSGGDPLVKDDAHLDHVLSSLDAMDHIHVLRIHTRIPSVWPQRITPRLCRMLSRHQPLFINLHVNHPDEITPAMVQACKRLADAGIALGSQSVLLKGVNDHPAILKTLFETLLKIRVRPYYLHQLDRVPGTAHFRVPLKTGMTIMDQLRGKMSGMAMPHYMIDLPGGGGKVEVPNAAVTLTHERQISIRAFNGEMYSYPLD